MDANWAQKRRENALQQAERMREREAAESAQASQHLKQFVAAAAVAGLEPQPLFMRSGSGKRARTPLKGWYIKADESVAVDEDGHFYLLTSPLSLRERLGGVNPTPSPPTLVLGKGGRDGEQIDLVDALTQRLPAWRESL